MFSWKENTNYFVILTEFVLLKDSDFWLKINILWNHKIYTTVAQLVVINFHFKIYFLLEFSSNNKTWNVKFIWCVKVQNRNCFDVFKKSLGYSASSIKRQICLVCNSTKQKLSTFLRHLLEIQKVKWLSLIHIWRCRRYSLCRSRWSPYH